MCCTIGKYLLFIVNVIFLLAGAALLGVGISYRLDFDVVTDLIPDDYNVDFAPTATIVLGAIIFVIAFFGCCGAIKENRCLLLTYAVILLLILIAQIAIGVVVFKRIESDDNFTFKDAVYNETEKVFANYTSNPNSVHVLQYTLECCGVQNSNYWGSSIPYSCCGKDESVSCTSSDSYETGCAERIYEILTKSSKVIGGVVIGIVAAEVIGIVFSCLFSRRIKKQKQHY